MTTAAGAAAAGVTQAAGSGARNVIDAALRSAAALTGMELVFLSGLSPTTFTWQAMHGSWAGISEGETMPRADSFCAAMLDGAPPVTANAASTSGYAELAFRTQLGVTSYVGVPVVTPAGVIGTLCAMDHGSVTVDDGVLAVMRALADVVSEAIDGRPTVRVVRTATGWRVDGAPRLAGVPGEVDGLPAALTLADLCGGGSEPPARPVRGEAGRDEAEQLRTQVRQLEHALAARVVIEQAIGALAERRSVAPREAFERLRKVARARGMRVHALAMSVVASTHEPVPALPPDLR